jgi:hypothetical protein
MRIVLVGQPGAGDPDGITGRIAATLGDRRGAE